MVEQYTIPHNFTPRDYQIPFLRAVEASVLGKSPIRNFMQIWHRRAGKDKVDIADVIPDRLTKDRCLVKMVYPTLVMGRDNLWDGIGGDGFPYMDHIPSWMREGKPNETKMRMRIKGGSILQIGGSNYPDTLRGGNPKMFVFSEWSEQDPYAWDVVEPIMKENDGISIFNLTPKGNNHARAMMEYAKNNPLWWVQILTARDTGIWSSRQLDEILGDIIKRFAADGRSEAEAVSYFEQEYMCSFTSPVIGSYYGEAMRRAEKEGRLTKVPVNESFPVNTAWDLGMDDSMTIWFFQSIGQSFHFVDYYENSGEGLAHYAKILGEKGYFYGKHYGPHDIKVRELGTGKSRYEVAKSLGMKFEVGKQLDVMDGINMTRTMFSRFYFDRDKCFRGISCLQNYKKDWDEKNKVFRTSPKHDWASHGADGLRTMSTGYSEIILGSQTSSPGGVKPYAGGV